MACQPAGPICCDSVCPRTHKYVPSREIRYSALPYVSRAGCVCPNLVPPSSCGKSLLRQRQLDDLAFWHLMRAAQGALCRSDGRAAASDQAERLRLDADSSECQFCQLDCRVSDQVSVCRVGRISFSASATTQSSSYDIRSSTNVLSHICRAAMASYIHDMLQRKCILLKTRQTLKLFWLVCGPARA
jgi:hypothetical protein